MVSYCLLDDSLDWLWINESDPKKSVYKSTDADLQYLREPSNWIESFLLLKPIMTIVSLPIDMAMDTVGAFHKSGAFSS